MLRLEYFIDNDLGFGQATAIPFSAATNVADISANIDITGLANGGHYLFVRSQDANGKYSATNSKYFEINNTTLPLTLVNYDAKLSGNQVTNHWQTENETNTSHFVIERSQNALDFIPLGSISAKNTKGQHSYSFNDRLSASLATQTLYYRLKQVDIDGKFNYSRTVPVKLSVDKKISIGANPATDVITVFAPKAKAISIISIIGSVMYSAYLNQAWDSVTIDISRFARGTYLVKVVGENNIIRPKR